MLRSICSTASKPNAGVQCLRSSSGEGDPGGLVRVKSAAVECSTNRPDAASERKRWLGEQAETSVGAVWVSQLQAQQHAILINIVGDERARAALEEEIVGGNGGEPGGQAVAPGEAEVEG